jgi:FkbM family methyltransferase
MNVSQRVRQTVGRLFDRPPQDVEIAPPELGGLRLVVPHGYEGFYSDGYEPDVARALARLVQPGNVCADLGAHIGYFAMLMAHRAGVEGRVVAFEASEENAGYIARSAELNRDQVRLDLRHAAVTDGSTATIELYPGRTGGAMEWTISQEFAEREDAAPTERQPVVVATVRLDDAFGPGEPLDVVKMDIEGGEGVALAGAERLLSEQRPVFLVEFHREVGWPAVEHLAAAGYHFESLDGERIPTPEDAAAVPYQFVASPR